MRIAILMGVLVADMFLGFIQLGGVRVRFGVAPGDSGSARVMDETYPPPPPSYP